MQLSQWVLRVPTPIRNHGHGSQSKNNERDPHVPEGQDHTSNKVQPLECKAMSIPILHPKDEDMSRIKG